MKQGLVEGLMLCCLLLELTGMRLSLMTKLDTVERGVQRAGNLCNGKQRQSEDVLPALFMLLLLLSASQIMLKASPISASCRFGSNMYQEPSLIEAEAKSSPV